MTAPRSSTRLRGATTEPSHAFPILSSFSRKNFLKEKGGKKRKSNACGNETRAVKILFSSRVSLSPPLRFFVDTTALLARLRRGDKAGRAREKRNPLLDHLRIA